MSVYLLGWRCEPRTPNSIPEAQGNSLCLATYLKSVQQELQWHKF